MTAPKEPQGFEERLLSQLRTVVSERGSASAPMAVRNARSLPWRRMALVGAAAALAVPAAVVWVLASEGDSAAAYTVDSRDGTVQVSIRETTDADGLRRALAAAGIRAEVTYLPAGMMCKPGRFATASEGSPETSIDDDTGALTFTLRPSALRDKTLVIETSRFTKGTGSLAVAVTAGAVGPCEQVLAPAMPPLPAVPEMPGVGEPTAAVTRIG
jgi:hypothetical protein